MPDEFFNGTNWQQSSEPSPLTFPYDASADLWPHGAGASKDTLADGLHPVLAIGPKALRPINLTGVVVTYESLNDRAQMDLADKKVVRNYVANVLTYSQGAPATFDTSMAIGEPVYVDDSTDLGAGVTLSRSPLNENAAANPLAGYLMYCQDEYDDSGVGGAEASASWPKTVANSLVENEYCVMLVNDCGIAGLS